MRNETVSSSVWLRLGGISAIGSGILGIVFEVLGFLSDAPPGVDRKLPILTLLILDYQRLLFLPGIIVLLAVVVLFLYLRPRMARMGLVSLAMLFGAYLLALVAQALDYLVFPNPLPGIGVGFFISLVLVIPLLLAGWMLLGISLVRARIEPRWISYLPVVASAWIWMIILFVLLEIIGISISLPISGSILVASAGGLVCILFGYLMLMAGRMDIVDKAA